MQTNKDLVYPGMYFTCAFGTRLWAAKKKIFYSWALRFARSSSNAVSRVGGFHRRVSGREFGLSPFVLSVQFCNMRGLFVGCWIGFKGPWLEQKLPNGGWFLKPEPCVGSWACVKLESQLKQCGWACAKSTSGAPVGSAVAGGRHLGWRLETSVLLPAQWGSFPQRASPVCVSLCAAWGRLTSVKLRCAALPDIYIKANVT